MQQQLMLEEMRTVHTNRYDVIIEQLDDLKYLLISEAISIETYRYHCEILYGKLT